MYKSSIPDNAPVIIGVGDLIDKSMEDGLNPLSLLQKVSENLTVQFPDYNRVEYDQALIDIKNYQDRLNAIGDHVTGIKRIN